MDRGYFVFGVSIAVFERDWSSMTGQNSNIKLEIALKLLQSISKDKRSQQRVKNLVRKDTHPMPIPCMNRTGRLDLDI